MVSFMNMVIIDFCWKLERSYGSEHKWHYLVTWAWPTGPSCLFHLMPHLCQLLRFDRMSKVTCLLQSLGVTREDVLFYRKFNYPGSRSCSKWFQRKRLFGQQKCKLIGWTHKVKCSSRHLLQHYAVYLWVTCRHLNVIYAFSSWWWKVLVNYVTQIAELYASQFADNKVMSHSLTLWNKFSPFFHLRHPLKDQPSKVSCGFCAINQVIIERAVSMLARRGQGDSI